MRKIKWQIYLGIFLIILSAIVYYIHYLLFHDSHHIFIYLVGDIAFVFIEVLMVTLVIHSLLNMREKREKLEKLNMLIGVFFSVVGTRLLVIFSDSDPNLRIIKSDLLVTTDWDDEQFSAVTTKLKKYSYDVEIDKLEVVNLRDFLRLKNEFLLRLLENPNLLEHESFTELLRAVFHLFEELNNRKNITKLTKTDLKHIEGDIVRVYGLLVYEWVDYMHYLKDNYPYLFSLAMRLNPFDEKATPEVKE